MDAKLFDRINRELSDPALKYEPTQEEVEYIYQRVKHYSNDELVIEYKEESLPVSAYVASFYNQQGGTKYVTSYYLPSALDLQLLLNEKGRCEWTKPLRLRKLLYVISFIVFNYVSKQTEWFGFVNVHSKAWRDVLGKRFALQTLSLLEEMGVVEINRRYRAGVGGVKGFTKSYRIARAYWSKKITLLKVISKRPHIRCATDESCMTNSVQQFVHSNIRRLRFDMTALKAMWGRMEMDSKLLARCETAAAYLESGKVDLTEGKKVRRLYHTIIRMPSGNNALRPRSFLRLDGSSTPLMEIDVKSAQPAMLLGLYDDMQCEEAQRYRVCLERGIYSDVTDNSITKERAKKQFGSFISNQYGSNTFGRGFTAKFPVLAKAVRDFNGSLSAHLQSMEADIVVYSVIDKCRELGCFSVPMHDGMIIESVFFGAVRVMLQNEFKKRFSFSPEIAVSWEQQQEVTAEIAA